MSEEKIGSEEKLPRNISEESENNLITIKRQLGFKESYALVIGSIVGCGIFISPTAILKQCGSVGLSCIIWILSGFFSGFTAYSLLELALMYPKYGGEYVWLIEGLGSWAGFLQSWVSVILINPSAIAVSCYVFSLYSLEPFYPSQADIPPHMLRGLAAVILVLLVVVNSIGVEFAFRVQIVFSVVKVLAIIVIIITGITRMFQGHTENFKEPFKDTTNDVAGLGAAFYAGFYAYGGWKNIYVVVEEVRKPETVLPLTVLSSMFTVTLLFLLVNVTYFACLSPSEILQSEAVAVTLADKHFGPMWWIMPVFIGCATFSSAHADVFTRGRSSFAAARNGHLPKILCLMHNEFETPITALIFNGMLSLAFLLPDINDFQGFLNLIYISGNLSILSVICLLIWFRYSRPRVPRPIKVWLIFPIFVYVIYLYFVISSSISDTLQTLFCLVILLLGIPVFFIFVVDPDKTLRHCLSSACDKFTALVQKHLNASFTEESPTLTT